MSNVAKGFAIGDTVYVYYRNSSTLRFLPQARTVLKVNTDTSGNGAKVEFSDGDPVYDIAADQRVFTTAALCATKIVSDVISEYTATVLLDATTSGASTAGQAATTLVRKN